MVFYKKNETPYVVAGFRFNFKQQGNYVTFSYRE